MENRKPSEYLEKKDHFFLLSIIETRIKNTTVGTNKIKSSSRGERMLSKRRRRITRPMTPNITMARVSRDPNSL